MDRGCHDFLHHVPGRLTNGRRADHQVQTKPRQRTGNPGLAASTPYPSAPGRPNVTLLTFGEGDLGGAGGRVQGTGEGSAASAGGGVAAVQARHYLEMAS